MANSINYKRLSLKFVEKNYPVLFNTLERGTKQLQANRADLATIKEFVAGLCLEIALKSDGTPSIFMEEDDDIFINEEID